MLRCINTQFIMTKDYFEKETTGAQMVDSILQHLFLNFENRTNSARIMQDKHECYFLTKSIANSRDLSG